MKLFCKHLRSKEVGMVVLPVVESNRQIATVYSECMNCGRIIKKKVDLEVISAIAIKKIEGIDEIIVFHHKGIEKVKDTIYQKFVSNYYYDVRVLNNLLIRLLYKEHNLAVIYNAKVSKLQSEVNSTSKSLVCDNKDIAEMVKHTISELQNMDYNKLLNLSAEEKLIISSPAGTAINKIHNKVLYYKYYDRVNYIEKEGSMIYTRRKNRKK